MKKLYFLALLLFSIALPVMSQRKLQLTDFLRNLSDLSQLPRYESETYSAEESTYDRTGMNNDGFGGQYSFLRRNPDSSLVIFEQKGPGVVNRIWTPTPTDDSLAFFIDNDERPAFTICYRDLFSGKVFPFVPPLCANQLGGFYCYLPIPFQSSCKIVFKGKLTRFHQIGYRLYPKGTTIKPFQLTLNEEEKTALKKVSLLWNKAVLTIKDLYPFETTTNQKNLFLQPGQTSIIYQTASAGRILGFEINAAAELNGVAKNIDLRVTYDDDKAPAIYCPLSDYFGYSFEKSSMQGFPIGSDGRHHYSWFHMPFDKSARVELIYRGDKKNSGPVNFNCVIYSNNKKRDAGNEGKFYAWWNRENPVPTGQPFTMLKTSGRGHFVGVALQAQGLVPGITGFFEGDDSTVVDGELRMHGTGSEDFFNGGWYALLDRWEDGMSLPLSGAIDYSLPLARTGGYRFFLNDKISFKKEFLQTMEHGPEHNRWPADYTSVAYYYNAVSTTQPQNPSTASTTLYTPDTLEIYPQLMFAAMDEYLSAEAKWMNILPAKTMFYTIQENSLIKMLLTDIPPGKYKMLLDYYKGPEGAKFSIWQRQTQITKWIDGYSETQTRIEKQEVSSLVVTPQNNTISFHFETPQKRNKFILNRIILIREKPVQ